MIPLMLHKEVTVKKVNALVTEEAEKVMTNKMTIMKVASLLIQLGQLVMCLVDREMIKIKIRNKVEEKVMKVEVMDKASKVIIMVKMLLTKKPEKLTIKLKLLLVTNKLMPQSSTKSKNLKV